ncbi:nuclear transport factor 2 family protein [Desulfopila sp. IMCC35008]|uniref:nuclear transport factor 2 family protein n=1 Tax=Desulfopila sp. IMCC35008 TaxID=2653858 RepID=UPI0013CF5260|nr:nuclear transport factor 2 family protein [Desulfopila sp. IMCC35008]
MAQNQETVALVDPVDAQLAAYNAHDIEKVVMAYSEQVQVYIFPQKLVCSGREELRNIYEEIFRVSPEVHAELLGRQIKKPFIIDHERLTGLQVDGQSTSRESLVIYRVETGAISAVWFLP